VQLSDEKEVGSGSEKKKKNKGMKEKIKEKLSDEDMKEEIVMTVVVTEHTNVVVAPAVPEASTEDTTMVVEKMDESVKMKEEKKGFLDKIKEKLSVHHEKENTTADYQEERLVVKQDETMSVSITIEGTKNESFF